LPVAFAHSFLSEEALLKKDEDRVIWVIARDRVILIGFDHKSSMCVSSGRPWDEPLRKPSP
jgi:hypothetical protein